MARKSYTVGQVNGYIKNLIGSDYLLSNIYIKGEVSNCKYHSSGHIYFSLKDETGSMPAVMFRSSVAAGLKFHLENGQQVTAHGYVDIYERDGRYQFYVKSVANDGVGNLYERYEQLKEKLYAQGLFEFEIKKPIPAYPKRVGIVTAPTGAAIQDIKNIAKRRNPYVQLILYPAKVQGEGAAADIARGIETLDRMQVDTIIIGRGGGSIEDLWAFNEEAVAWAIYHAKTPIISGTGHEIDNTIADYAADLRAPTPSAACEIAIPDVMSVVRGLDTSKERMEQLMRQKADRTRERLALLYRQLMILHPKQRLATIQVALDELSDRMRRAMHLSFERTSQRFRILAERLNGLSPSAKLVYGFGYVTRDDAPVTTIANVQAGDHVNIRIHDGSIEAVVTSIEENK